MNQDLRKNPVAVMADRSLIVNAFRKAALWFYRSISSGFFGTLFTSFGKEEELFRRSLRFVTRRARDLANQSPPPCGRRFEDSLLLGILNAGAQHILGCSTERYTFSLIFGIYAMLMYTYRTMPLAFGSIYRFCPRNDSFALGAHVFSKKSLAECISRAAGLQDIC